MREHGDDIQETERGPADSHQRLVETVAALKTGDVLREEKQNAKMTKYQYKGADEFARRLMKTHSDFCRAVSGAVVSLDGVSDCVSKVPKGEKRRDGNDGAGLEGIRRSLSEDAEEV